MRGSSPDRPESGSELAKPDTVEIGRNVFFTPEGLARALGITVRTLGRWDAARIGPPKAKVGKTILYNLENITSWLASRETTPVRSPDSRRR